MCPDRIAEEEAEENPAFLKEQIVTYLGNKRSLLDYIEAAVRHARARLGGRKLRAADLFSGSGIVARLLKRHAELLVANDLESHAAWVNRCYLANADEVRPAELEEGLRWLREQMLEPKEGFISELYAPRCDELILPGERAFFTRRNACFLDTARQAIEHLPASLRRFFLAPLLYGASVHNNTSGVFKGFYKNHQGIGQFGGERRQALSRITGDIELMLPVFSRFRCDYRVEQAEALELAESLPELDFCYIDPPYNQHPYGSNYFMLNLIAEYKRPREVSQVSGIPADWNRSVFNAPGRAREALFRLLEICPAKFLLVSYNSEGFIDRAEFMDFLAHLGRVECTEIPYNTFRASRNLHARPLRVKEYLFLVERS